MNPDKAPITKTSNENLKIKFLYWGKDSYLSNNFNVRVNSTINVKKLQMLVFKK